jgi:hypothetical protein
MSWKPTHPRHSVIVPINFTICFNVIPFYYGSREFLAPRDTDAVRSHTLGFQWLWACVDMRAYMCFWILNGLRPLRPITVAAGSKAWSALARSNGGIVGSNPTQGMDVCVRLFCVYVVLCVGSGLSTGWSPVQGVLQTVLRLSNWSETKRFTDVLRFEVWATGKKEREREGSIFWYVTPHSL